MKTYLFLKNLINFIFSKIEKIKKFKNEIEYLELSHNQCYQANLNFNNQSNFYYKKIISKCCHDIKFKEQFKIIKEFNLAKHIFIIGLPRSGSSLVETIITHNSNNVISVGEFHGVNTSILDQIGKIIYSENFDIKNYKIEINKSYFKKVCLKNILILKKIFF